MAESGGYCLLCDVMIMDSSKPSKQRKALYQAKQHMNAGKMNVHLAKSLRKQIGRRSIGIRVGDKVTVVKGSNAKKSGKVSSVNTHKGFIFLDGITRKKSDGTEIGIPFRTPNLLIAELETKDARRFKRGKKPVQKKAVEEKKEGKDKKEEAVKKKKPVKEEK